MSFLKTVRRSLVDFVRKLFNTSQIANQLNDIERKIDFLKAEHEDAVHYHDLMLMLDRIAPLASRADFTVKTEHPIALESHDHIYPHGTRQDNTRSPRFVRACERRYSGPIRFLDLGCSGGGIVLDFLLRGHIAAGVEGSDYSLRALRAEWRVVPRNLMVCDITKPFQVYDAGQPAQFDVISAWEVMEHIATQDLPKLLENVRLHLAAGGIFVGSVSCEPSFDPVTGAQWHQTIQPQSWWEQYFQDHGWTLVNDHPFGSDDYCRGVGNGWRDVDLRQKPDVGFHYVIHPSAGEMK